MQTLLNHHSCWLFLMAKQCLTTIFWLNQSLFASVHSLFLVVSEILMFDAETTILVELNHHVCCLKTNPSHWFVGEITPVAKLRFLMQVEPVE